MADRTPTCEYCEERPATCRGHYAHVTRPVYACDACCTHALDLLQCEPLMLDDPRAYVS